MIISKTPIAYQGAYPEVIYQLEGADPDTVVEVEILDTSGINPIGRKRVSGYDMYELNVATYIQRQFDVTPIVKDSCGIYQVSGRVVNAGIRCGELVSSIVPITSGIVGASVGSVLTDKPNGTKMVAGDVEEIAFIAPGEHVSGQIKLVGNDMYVFDLDPMDCGSGMYVAIVSTPDIENRLKTAGKGPISTFHTLQLTLQMGADNVWTHSWQLVNKLRQGVRVCWMNRFGAVDGFTFDRIGTESVSVEKQRIYSGIGYEVTESLAETEIVLTAESGTTAYMKWMGGLIASPRVWIQGDDGYVPVDVLSDTWDVRSVDLPVCQIRVRPCQKIVYQHF